MLSFELDVLGSNTGSDLDKSFLFFSGLHFPHLQNEEFSSKNYRFRIGNNHIPFLIQSSHFGYEETDLKRPNSSFKNTLGNKYQSWIKTQAFQLYSTPLPPGLPLAQNPVIL